jgi:predicted nuclease of restriction endonuclease-like RecB superfamily
MYKARGKEKDPRGGMNRTESEFWEFLLALKNGGRISNFVFERYTLKLAERTNYTPDFCVFHLDGLMEFVEIKGFWRDDARVKFKVAADRFPWHDWTAVKKKGRNWEQEVIKTGLQRNRGVGILLI